MECQKYLNGTIALLIICAALPAPGASITGTFSCDTVLADIRWEGLVAGYYATREPLCATFNGPAHVNFRVSHMGIFAGGGYLTFNSQYYEIGRPFPFGPPSADPLDVVMALTSQFALNSDGTTSGFIKALHRNYPFPPVELFRVDLSGTYERTVIASNQTVTFALDLDAPEASTGVLVSFALLVLMIVRKKTRPRGKPRWLK